MLEKGKISSLQMATLLFPTVSATAVLLVPAITARYAGRDLWLTPILGSLAGFAIVYVAWRLNQFYPEETVIQFAERIIGRIPGKIVGFLILLFFLHMNAIVIREYAEFVKGNFLPRTPRIVLMASMLLVCAYAVRGGIEVIARCAQIYTPLVMIFVLAIIVLPLPESNPANMLPILENGVAPLLKGSLVLQSWFTAAFLISFILPSVKDRNNALKWGMIAIFSIMITLTFTNLSVLFLFGGISSDVLYPIMSAARYIQYADFFEHLESMVMALWIAGNFIQMAVFFYSVVLGTAQLFNLRDYRTASYPICFLVLLFGIWITPNLMEFSKFLGTSQLFYTLLMRFLIPALLLIIAVVIHKYRKQNTQP